MQTLRLRVGDKLRAHVRLLPQLPEEGAEPEWESKKAVSVWHISQIMLMAGYGRFGLGGARRALARTTGALPLLYIQSSQIYHKLYSARFGLARQCAAMHGAARLGMARAQGFKTLCIMRK